MKKFVVAVAIAALASCAQSQTPPPDPGKITAAVNHLMDVHIGVERKTPPGWSIRVQPVAEGRGEDGKPIVQVHIFIKGAPAGVLFEQQVLPLGEDTPTSTMQGISVGKDGILMCAGRVAIQCGDPQRPDDPIEFTMSPIKGEPFRFLFTSGYGTIGTVIVPDPVAAKNRGCTISAVRLTNRFELALITGTGFPPNTDIHYTTNSGIADDLIAHSNEIGVIRFGLIPHVKDNQKSGTMKVQIKESQCSPDLSYDWGKL